MRAVDDCGDGLHLVTPFTVEGTTLGWPEAKEIARQICSQMASDSPDRYLVKMAKKDRVGRISLDYLAMTGWRRLSHHYRPERASMPRFPCQSYGRRSGSDLIPNATRSGLCPSSLPKARPGTATMMAKGLCCRFSKNSSASRQRPFVRKKGWKVIKPAEPEAPSASIERPFHIAIDMQLLCKRRRENPSLKRPESLVAPEQKCIGR